LMAAIDIYEVGARDGLQNEPEIISTSDKIALVDALTLAGFKTIEATSFVSPKWIPQMADAAELMARITRSPDTAYAVLTPNRKGLDDALKAEADEVAVFGAASEGFSQHNINSSIAESLERFAPLVAVAEEANTPVRGYISCVISCPYDGRTAPEAVLDIGQRLLDMGCYEISLGDTTGMAQPDDIARLLDVVCRRIPAEKLAGHYHDTGGHAIANVERSLAYGLRRFDSAIGGLGGCPYAPKAKGNVATLPLVTHLHGLGHTTGLDVDALEQAGQLAAAKISRLKRH
jgi:hydroxymethylglutaryl-CoA lyase